jgi:hypothetical protein
MAMDSLDCIRALALAGAAGNTLCIRGPSGIGKTSITEQYADTQEGPYFYGVFNGATANLADTIGFLLPHDVAYQTSDGREVNIAHGRYTYPHYFMDRKTGQPAFMFKRGLIVIEEYGQAQGDVKRGLAPLVHNGEKRMGEHALPVDFQVVLLTNRASDRSGVGKDFDFIINRRVEIEFRPALEPWLIWASENDVEPVVMAFAKKFPEIVFKGEHPEKQGPWCTPRSLVDAGKTIRAAGATESDFDAKDSFLMQNLMGSIGNTAVQLMAFLKLRHSLPQFDDIINDPLNTPVPAQPDSKMIITFELAHKATKGSIDPIVQYMERMEKAFAVTFMQVLFKRAPAIASSKTIGDWSRKNHQLLAAISR